jgi:hypothetical protein
MLDFLDPKIIIFGFTSLLASGSYTLIAGADQGQGAWCRWIKITTLLSNTVSQQISEGYDKLLNYKLTFIKPPAKDAKVHAIFIPKDAQDVKLDKLCKDPSTCCICYSLHSTIRNGFIMSYRDKETFPEGSDS